METLDIGICILFFNKVDQTIDCIKSFLPSRTNIYILNNGSDQAFRKQLGDFCNKYPNITIYDFDSNLGISVGRNELIKRTTEDWLLFVDNDITIRPRQWISIISNHIKFNPGIEVFIPRLNNVHEHRYSRETYCEISTDGEVQFLTTQNGLTNMYPGGASIISRKLFERIGLYEPKIFVGFEDFEMAIRAIKEYTPIKGMFVKDIELVHRHIFTSSTEDQKAIKIRYNYELIQASHDFILKKYGIDIKGEFKPWLDEQIRQLSEKQSFKDFLKEKFVQFRTILRNI